VRRSLAISAHFPLVEPAADFGLTITKGSELSPLEEDLLVFVDKLGYFLDGLKVAELIVAVLSGCKGLTGVNVHHILIVIGLLGGTFSNDDHIGQPVVIKILKRDTINPAAKFGSIELVWKRKDLLALGKNIVLSFHVALTVFGIVGSDKTGVLKRLEVDRERLTFLYRSLPTYVRYHARRLGNGVSRCCISFSRFCGSIVGTFI